MVANWERVAGMFFPFTFSSFIFLILLHSWYNFKNSECYILLWLEILRLLQTWNKLLKEEKTKQTLNYTHPIQANCFRSGNFKHSKYLGLEHYAGICNYCYADRNKIFCMYRFNIQEKSKLRQCYHLLLQTLLKTFTSWSSRLSLYNKFLTH